jgi:hypothetical protein
MAFESIQRWRVLCCMLLLFCSQSDAQAVRRVTEMGESEQREFLMKTLDAGLPESEIDQLGLLSLNRSDLVIPELIRRIEVKFHDHTLPDRSITLMAGMVAYAANERAIDGVSRLCEIDAEKFGFLVARVFDYSVERRNPYTLVYYALTNHSITDGLVLEWVSASVRFPGNDKKWARALLERYNGPPSVTNLRSDPLLFRLKGGLPDSVKRELDSMIQSAREAKR